MRVKDPALTRRPASEIAADVHRCAEQARRGLAAAGCIVDAAEHRAARLRALAAAQLAEATQQQDPTLWRTAAAILKGK